MKRAKYVERLRYFEDAPTVGMLEANTIDRLNEDYYNPFLTRNLRNVPIISSSCANFRNPYDCQNTSSCGWDGTLSSCYVMPGSNFIKMFSFKEKMRNLNRNKSYLKQ
jgi:hypothetical protein